MFVVRVHPNNTPVPYKIAEEHHLTKGSLLARCRSILSATPNGASVSDKDVAFLFELFEHHDEWGAKSEGGVREISAMQTSHGTRCFVLLKHDGTSIDISFPHAVRHVLSVRSAELQPQPLRDFRSAARCVIRQDIWAFRDRALLGTPLCPITGENLAKSNCVVDHVPPATFDWILFQFCREHSINPLAVAVGSHKGTLAVFDNKALSQSWQRYHQANAHLRLISRLANLRLQKVKVPWYTVCG